MTEEMRNTYMEYLTLMDLALKEYEENRNAILSKDWDRLSISCSKMAILAHKISTVDKKLSKLKEDYMNEISEN